VPESASSTEVFELWVYIQDRLARLTKDTTLIPDVPAQRFSLAPLSGVDVVDAPEPLQASDAEGAAINGMRNGEAGSEEERESLAEIERRNAPLRPTLFSRPEPGARAFGRRNVAHYAAGRGK